ncbi:MAG TPA: FctA domain-containing protein, partial [Candidatus Limiplasma sp.]|nr:FctA domain-containing protein [Candidatus Limiplasma sp.]
TIADLGNGVLEATLVEPEPEDTIFNNTYTASGEFNVDATVNPTKVLTGRILSDHEFAFVLKQGDTVLETVYNVPNGNIPFTALTYTQDDIDQTYEYTINEVIPATTETYMTYDTMTLTFSVTITDLGNGELSADLADISADTVFNNVYDVPLTRYRIYYYYRMTEDDAYVRNEDYDYLSDWLEVGTRADSFADRSENGFWQLVGSDGNRRVLVVDEDTNIVRVYYQRSEVPLGGGVVINVGDCSE